MGGGAMEPKHGVMVNMSPKLSVAVSSISLRCCECNGSVSEWPLDKGGHAQLSHLHLTNMQQHCFSNYIRGAIESVT